MLNTELTYDPAILLLGIHPKGLETRVHTKLCSLMFIAVLFIIAKKKKNGNNPNVFPLMNRKIKYDMSLQ